MKSGLTPSSRNPGEEDRVTAQEYSSSSKPAVFPALQNTKRSVYPLPCPRCGELRAVVHRSDIYGTYLDCLFCGWHGYEQQTNQKERVTENVTERSAVISGTAHANTV